MSKDNQGNDNQSSIDEANYRSKSSHCIAIHRYKALARELP